jgi:hypothetical protein
VFGIDFSSLPESFDASGQVSSKPGEVHGPFLGEGPLAHD